MEATALLALALNFLQKTNNGAVVGTSSCNRRPREPSRAVVALWPYRLRRMEVAEAFQTSAGKRQRLRSAPPLAPVDSIWHHVRTHSYRQSRAGEKKHAPDPAPRPVAGQKRSHHADGEGDNPPQRLHSRGTLPTTLCFSSVYTLTLEAISLKAGHSPGCGSPSRLALCISGSPSSGSANLTPKCGAIDRCPSL